VISRVRGTLVARNEDSVEILTPGGVAYEVDVPLSVAMRLPPVGDQLELRTVHVVREDASLLFGFLEAGERSLFERLIQAQGVGTRLALAMLSTYPAPRLARALAEKDVTALVQVPGVGRKTAERLILELGDRLRDLAVGDGPTSEPVAGAQAAVQALIALGMSFPDADQAVRAVLEGGAPSDTNEIVRRALALR
jgi:holliday junction DNA helicase RuvA